MADPSKSQEAQQALDDLLSGDQTRIERVLLTYIITVDWVPRTVKTDKGVLMSLNEYPPSNGGPNCAVYVIPQKYIPGVTEWLQFKRASSDELEQEWDDGKQPVATTAMFFPARKIDRATTEVQGSCNLDVYFKDNELPAVTFPCIALLPQLNNDVLVWTKDARSGLPRICVLDPVGLNHGDDVGRNLHPRAVSTYSPQARPLVMGPDDYRRQTGEGYKAGGMRTQDFCNVIGIWFSGSWHIYAQKTRPHVHNTKVNKAVSVWEIYPSYMPIKRRDE
jgi:hypothetical protein